MSADETALELLRRAATAAEEANAQIAVLAEQVRSVRSTADANHRLLHGNGEEGLKGRLSHVERTARETRRKLHEFISDDGQRRRASADAKQSALRARLEAGAKVVVAALALTGTVLSAWLAITMGGG